MIEQNIFRVSAVIYAGQNYDVSPRQIHRKVIQDALYSLGDRFVNIGTLAEYIEQNYSLLFSSEEIMAIFTDKSFKEEFEIQDIANENIYQLTAKRRLTLRTRQKKTLKDYICQYLQENEIVSTYEDCIMQFLYNMFTNNVDSYERLLQTKKINVEASNKIVNQEDAIIINGFLDWDNEEKNIEIFNLACYALEYCMLTSKKSSHFSLEYLKNKVFYLDTNILYRAIGINGEDRKKRALLFFSKFKSINNELKISKSTLDEFELSINSYIKKLRKSETPAIHSSVYSEYVTMDDIWRYYHLWRAKRSNGTVEYFANYLKSEFDSICERYNIELDNNQPFVIGNCENELNSNAASIMGLSDKKSFETACYDAQNVKWVECKRIGSDKSIFDAKYFLLSSDGGLRFWDVKYHSKNAPIVIMPSQWLSIMLRYMERTSDDFKSFVCFLNIKTGFDTLTEEQIHYVLQGISEVTTDIEQQRFLLKTIVENDFKNGAKDLYSTQIVQIAKKNSERLLQEQLEKEKAKNATLENEVRQELVETKAELDAARSETKTHDEHNAAKIDELTDLVSKKKSEVDRISEDNNVKDKELELYRKKDFSRRKRNKLILLGVAIVLIVIHIVWMFIVDETSQTYMGDFVRWLKSLDEVRSELSVPIFNIILTAILLPLCIYFYKTCKKRYTKAE